MASPGHGPDEFLQSMKLELSAWRSPGEFQEILGEIRRRVSPYIRFKSPSWGFWRDAWIIGRFAVLVEADRVQLAAPTEQYPDGRVRIGSEILEVEATEAMMPGRRRANEYAPDAPRMQHDPIEEWDRRLDEVPMVLDRVISKKIRKNYGRGLTLLVYLNIEAYDCYRADEVRSEVVAIKQRYAGKFRYLYILWGKELL